PATNPTGVGCLASRHEPLHSIHHTGLEVGLRAPSHLKALATGHVANHIPRIRGSAHPPDTHCVANDGSFIPDEGHMCLDAGAVRQVAAGDAPHPNDAGITTFHHTTCEGERGEPCRLWRLGPALRVPDGKDGDSTETHNADGHAYLIAPSAL